MGQDLLGILYPCAWHGHCNLRPAVTLRLPFAVIVASGCAAAADTADDDPLFPDASARIADSATTAHPDAAPRPDGDPSDDAAPDAPPCVGGEALALDPESGHCYRLFTQEKSWGDAQGLCQSGGYGSLVAIASAAENEFVRALADGREVWMGATDSLTEDVFVWTSGEPFTFTYWAGGQPDNGSGSEDCVLMRAGSGGRWNDDQCGNDHDYVCEHQ